jgi:iron complex outermembrane receptor protein
MVSRILFGKHPARPLSRCVSIAALCAVQSAFATPAETAGGQDTATSVDTSPARVVVTGERAGTPEQGYVATRSATASKTDTPIIEEPQSISLITADQMQAQAVQSVGQALRYTPGVIGEQYGGVNDTIDYYVVRGFPNQFPFVDGLSTATYFTLLAPSVDPYGLERVDVLRGPASVLYGQNIPGGMINLTTKHPTDTPLHEVSLDAGNYGSLGGRFDVGGRLAPDGSLSYRVTGDAGTAGSQVDFQTDKHAYLAPALSWRPSASTTLTLLSHFNYRDSGYPTADLPAVGTLYPGPNGQRIGSNVFDGEPGFNMIRRTEAALGYEFEHRVDGGLVVRQNLRYTHVNLDERIAGNAGLEDDQTTIDRWAYAAAASADVFALDNQGQFKFDTGTLRHTALVGLDYLHSTDRWAEADAVSLAPLDLYHPVYGGALVPGDVDFSVEHHVRQLGLYAQDQIHVGQLVATLGVRKDWAHTTEFDRLAGQNDQDNAPDKLTWRTGLVYLTDSGFAPYVSYATSFQPGLGNTFNGAPLAPTTGRSAEAGVKYQPASAKGFAMLSLYDTRQRNVVEPDFDHPEGNFVVQTGAQRVKGGEVSGVAELGAGLRLTGAYTWMDGTITDSDQGYAGKQAVNVPHNMASLWFDKTFGPGWLPGFGFGAGERFIGAQYGDQGNLLRMPSVTLVDAAIHYDTGRWRWSLNAQNLFDRVYVNCQGANYCGYGLRRAVIARLTYQW